MWEDVDLDNMFYEVSVYFFFDGFWFCLVFNDFLYIFYVVCLFVLSDFGRCYFILVFFLLIWLLSFRKVFLI